MQNILDRRRLLAIASLSVAGGSTAAMAQTAAPSLDLSPYHGRVVYLDFWASWCAPCKLSFPFMEQLTSSFSKKDFVVIAVNVDHSREKAVKFLEDVGSRLPVFFDSKGVVATKYHVQAMPTTVLIDRSGRLRYTHEGFFLNETSTYEDHIMRLIDEKYTASTDKLPIIDGIRRSNRA